MSPVPYTNGDWLEIMDDRGEVFAGRIELTENYAWADQPLAIVRRAEPDEPPLNAHLEAKLETIRQSIEVSKPDLDEYDGFQR